VYFKQVAGNNFQQKKKSGWQHYLAKKKKKWLATFKTFSFPKCRHKSASKRLGPIRQKEAKVCVFVTHAHNRKYLPVCKFRPVLT
jgi:hypothetical protein